MNKDLDDYNRRRDMSATPEPVAVNRSSGKNAKAKAIKKPATPARKEKPGPLTGARKARLPELIKPELATLVEKAPDGEWRYEVKFDGYRIMARIDHDEVKLFTRNGHDWTHKLPGQAEALAALHLESAWLDGEMVVVDEEGVPDFQALQNAFEAGRSGHIVYYLFDLPYLNGVDLREVPVEERRAALATVLKAGDHPLLRFSDGFEEEPQALLNSACQMRMEGLIGKRLGSPYVSRRSSDWVKLKCKHRQEFVIVGFTDPKGSRSAFGALLLGLHDRDSGELRYAGKVGTGFNEATLASLHGQLKPLQTKKPAVVNPPDGVEFKTVHWLKPRLLAEVAFAEITRDGSVRHAVFHGLRDDKPAKGITEERAMTVKTAPGKKSSAAKPTAAPKNADPAPSDIGLDKGKVRITHPDRIIDASSGSTKMQLAQYYATVAEWILPELKDRPVALVRAPDGIAGELFFQKNAEHLAIPGITTLDQKLTGQPMMVINNAEALIGAVQMSTVELHTWNATSDNLDKPDRFLRNYYNGHGIVASTQQGPTPYTANWDGLERQLIYMTALVLPGDTIDICGTANIMSEPNDRVGDLLVYMDSVILGRARNTHSGSMYAWQSYVSRGNLLQRRPTTADPAAQVSISMSYLPISTGGLTWTASNDGVSTRLFLTITPYKWA